MGLGNLALVILLLAMVGWAFGRARAVQQRIQLGNDKRSRAHSLPAYHGWYVAAWVAVPALAFLTLWAVLMPHLVREAVLASPGGSGLPTDPFVRNTILGEAHALADGTLRHGFHGDAPQLIAAFRAATAHYGMIGAVTGALLAFVGGAFGFTRIQPALRARVEVERLISLSLLLASLVAIVATFGIVASLVGESFRFFELVPPTAFLSGLEWDPPSGAAVPSLFGAVPLFWGTVMIGAIIAMIVAIPLGLLSAIYLSQYAHPAVRDWMKPILEVLAGVPTVVYGYFAALTVGPALRGFADAIGVVGASSDSALAAGVVMGIMIIPLVSSMADDSLTAVPHAMRDGSLALGATKSETIRQVLIPAALPGVIGGVLLAVSRAIGETMIVVMAAGQAANLSANPFASVTTVTVQIVKLMTGDQEFDSAKTLAAFALGLVLFIVTLLLNIVALRIVKRYREAYD